MLFFGVCFALYILKLSMEQTLRLVEQHLLDQHKTYMLSFFVVYQLSIDKVQQIIFKSAVSFTISCNQL